MRRHAPHPRSRARPARSLAALLGVVALGSVIGFVLTGSGAPVVTVDAVGDRPVMRARATQDGSARIGVGPTVTPSTTSSTTTTTTMGPAVEAPTVATDCGDALAYLASHQAPGFVDVCGPGTALGHFGFTCWNTPVHCPDGAKVIHIACPAPFVYMNEAHNSWSLQGLRTGVDPYGQGNLQERQFCDRFR
ncbi:MAG: hypothetical protein ABJC79_04590 [Acidimicrobiia bacterium]